MGIRPANWFTQHVWLWSIQSAQQLTDQVLGTKKQENLNSQIYYLSSRHVCRLQRQKPHQFPIQSPSYLSILICSTFMLPTSIVQCILDGWSPEIAHVLSYRCRSNLDQKDSVTHSLSHSLPPRLPSSSFRCLDCGPPSSSLNDVSLSSLAHFWLLSPVNVISPIKMFELQPNVCSASVINSWLDVRHWHWVIEVQCQRKGVLCGLFAQRETERHAAALDSKFTFQSPATDDCFAKWNESFRCLGRTAGMENLTSNSINSIHSSSGMRWDEKALKWQ